MSLLTVAPFTAESAKTTEKLLDFIYLQSGKESIGNCLLVASHDCHEELMMLVSTSGENAFQNLELIQAPEFTSTNPTEVNNFLFKFAAEYIAKHYRIPWLWLEPTCVPLKKDWREHLTLAYNSQPKRFMGGHIQFQAKPEPQLALSRVSVYPPDAIGDLAPFCIGAAHFNLPSGQYIVPRSTKSRLVQELNYEGDFTKVRPDACILNGDKTGGLIEKLSSEIPETNSEPITKEYTARQMTPKERMAHARKFRRSKETQVARL